MDESKTIATFAILVVTFVTSVMAFRRPDLRERWIFDPRAILAGRQYQRLLTSGLIHADWPHLLFNAFSFYAFAGNIELLYGAKSLLLIYVASILGGSLLSLLIHRHHEYRALGASGGVCGVIFASIFLLPGSRISGFLLPIPIPAGLYAVVFMVGSYLAHRRKSDNIGHDAHLGGAIIGLLTATALYPDQVLASPKTLAVVLGVSILILVVLLCDPVEVRFRRREQSTFYGGERARRYEENRQRKEKAAEVDRLLEKVSQQGIHSLTPEERQHLERLSREVYGTK